MELPIEEIAALGCEWHGALSLCDEVLYGIARLAPADVSHTAETGCGRSTLLFSHLSSEHVVFVLGEREGSRDDSMRKTVDSPLLESQHVQFVLGPTQLTVPKHEFGADLDMVLIDGPHGFPFPVLEYYYFYPHVKRQAPVLDDIHIPSITFLFDFLLRITCGT
jgi:hypothetical protein